MSETKRPNDNSPSTSITALYDDAPMLGSFRGSEQYILDLQSLLSESQDPGQRIEIRKQLPSLISEVVKSADLNQLLGLVKKYLKYNYYWTQPLQEELVRRQNAASPGEMLLIINTINSFEIGNWEKKVLLNFPLIEKFLGTQVFYPEDSALYHQVRELIEATQHKNEQDLEAGFAVFISEKTPDDFFIDLTQEIRQ